MMSGIKSSINIPPLELGNLGSKFSPDGRRISSITVTR